MTDVTLASTSEIRAELLRGAGLKIEVVAPRIDEDALKSALLAEGRKARDIADALAEAKSQKVGAKIEKGLVLGCDQVLEVQGELLSKPASPEDAMEQLCRLRGAKHSLWTGAVICEGPRPVWRHVARVDLTMRDASDPYLAGYVERNWNSIRHSVGSYKLEEEGARLMTRVQGDYFTVLGLPLLEILSWLTLRGTLEG